MPLPNLITSTRLKLKLLILNNMTLSKREKTAIAVSHTIILYSSRMQDGKIPEHQSIIDFVLKNIPQEFKSELSMELIDDVFTFMSEQRMELS